ncbi:MAG: nitroreductase/quinone reductase family protein [Nocardioides sp.]
MSPAAKRRLVRAFERYVQNPPIKLVLRLGVPFPMLSLLETTGRRTGKTRRVPVIRGLDGDIFWIVAEHGHDAAYVRNIKANPAVRIKLGRRWRHGTAHILNDDDPMARAQWMKDHLGGWHRFDVIAVRMFGTEPVTVRVDLYEPVASA